MDFLGKYPIDLSEIIVTPMIVRESVKEHIRLPAVCLTGIRAHAEYAGFSYGALRTAVTRLKKNGVINAFDDNGTTRYELCDFFNFITRHYTTYKDEDGFTVAVLSLVEGGEKARYHIREILKTFGFQQISRNAYISGKMDIKGLQTELAKNSLENNLFIFDCNPMEDPGSLERIKKLWDLDEWTQKAEAFRDDLLAYYDFSGLDDAEIYNRIFSVGPAFYKYIQRDFPRLHEKHFPGRTVYNEINRIINETSTKLGERLTGYFISINQQERS